MRYWLSLLFGLVLGSFANVCIHRLPQGGSIRSPRSRCPNCKTPLRWKENLPIVSFLLLRGRCATCRKPISWQYPLVELLMAGLFLLSAWWYSGEPYRILIVDLLSFYLLTISLIDARHKIIPDELSLSLLGFGLLFSWWNPWMIGHALPPTLESLLAALLGGGGMLILAWVGGKIFKKEALGGGDVKLMAAFGAVLGWTGLLGSLMLGSMLGALFAGGLLLVKRKKKGETIPFGPFLSLGAYLTCLFPAWWIPFLFP